MARSINPVPQYLDDAGDPLVSGKLYFYDSGSNNPKTTYADVNLTIANTNPVILTGSGRTPNIFFDGTAKVKLTDSDEVQIWEKDPVGGEAGGAFSDWDAITAYAFEDFVTASDNKFYESLIPGNQGNDPVSSPASWAEIKFVGVYNVNQTYLIDDVAQGADGFLYISLASANLGNPVSDVTKWGPSTNLTGVTITNPTIIGAIDTTFTGSLTEDTYILTGLDLDPANGTIQTKTMAANTTFTSSIADGQFITLHLIGGDVYTVTYPTITWIGGSAPTLTAKDVIEFWKVSTTLYGAYVGGYT